jgi:U4/U6.U5 tri-snRNP-associated protein 3
MEERGRYDAPGVYEAGGSGVRRYEAVPDARFAPSERRDAARELAPRGLRDEERRGGRGGDDYLGRGNEYGRRGDDYRRRGDEYGRRGDEYGRRGDEYGRRGEDHGRRGDEQGRRGGRSRSRSRSPGRSPRARSRSGSRSPEGSCAESTAAPELDEFGRVIVKAPVAGSDTAAGAGVAGDPGDPGEEEDMAALLGFSGFASSKGKKVSSNEVGAAVGAIAAPGKREYRQYMNRAGGFNRSLSKVKTTPKLMH